MLPTIITCIVVAGVVALAVFSLIKDKKKGKGSCGNSCASCPMCEKCHDK